MGTKSTNVYSPNVKVTHPVKCKKCKYSCAVGGCDYILVTGHMRGCPAGDNCIRFEPKDGQRKWSQKMETITEWQQGEASTEAKYTITPPKPKEQPAEQPLKGFKAFPLKPRKERDMSWVTRRMQRTDDRYRPLYDAGMNDVQIAKEWNTTSSTVQAWRSSRGLPSIIEIKAEQRAKEKAAKRPHRVNLNAMYRDYYNQGLSDQDIAESCKSSANSVACWRYRNNLPSNVPSYQSKRNNTDKLYRPLYDQGLNDHQIAEIVHVSNQSIYLWRKTRGLPKNFRKENT